MQHFSHNLLLKCSAKELGKQDHVGVKSGSILRILAVLRVFTANTL